MELCYKAAMLWNHLGEIRGEVTQFDKILW
jgi:hypothetical protein